MGTPHCAASRMLMGSPSYREVDRRLTDAGEHRPDVVDPSHEPDAVTRSDLGDHPLQSGALLPLAVDVQTPVGEVTGLGRARRHGSSGPAA